MNIPENTFSNAPFGVVYHRLILNDSGDPIDFEIKNTAGAFEELTGIKSTDIIGKKFTSNLSELPEGQKQWLEIFSGIVLLKKTEKTEFYYPVLQKWYQIHPWVAGELLIGTLLTDITDQRPSENQVESKEKEVQEIFSNIPHSIFTIDVIGEKKFRIKEVNKTQLEYIDKSINEVQGKLIEEIFPTNIALQLKNNYQRCVELGEKITYEEEVALWDMGQHFFLTTLTPVKDDSGIVTTLIGSSVDITQRKKAERAIEQSETLHSKLISNIGDVIVIIDKNLKNIYKSPNVEKLFGWKAEELIGKDALYLIHPDDMPIAFNFIDRLVVKPEAKASDEVRYLHKDGSYRWIKFTAVNLLDDPDIQGILGNYHDITERKEAEEALNREREFNHALLETASDGIVACDASGELVLFNRAAREWHGVDVMNIPIEEGRDYFNLFHIDGETPLKPDEIPLVRAYKGEIVQNAGMSIVTKGQPARFIYANGAPVLDEDGKKLGAVVIMHDVTERLSMEQKLRENEERLSATLKSIGDGVISCDKDGKVLSINNIASKLTGWAPEEARGEPIENVFKIVHAKTGEIVTNPVEQALREGDIVGIANHTVLISRSGKEYKIADSCAPIRNSENDIIGCVLVFRDITEEYEQRDKLKKSEERFRTLAQNVPGVIYLCNNKERSSMTFVNDQIEKLTGYTSEEFQQSKIEFTELVHPDDAAWITKEIEKALLEHKPFQLNYRIRHRSGEWRWVLENGVGLFDTDGSLNYLEGYLTDITEYKEAEELVYQASQQLAFHIENSPLAVIVSDENFNIKEWSKTAEQLFGWEEEEILSKNLDMLSFVHEGDRENVQDKIDELIKGKAHRNMGRNRNYTKSGDVLYCEWYNSAMFDQDGKIISIFSLVNDISERKEKEHQLEESLKEKEVLLAEIHHRVKNNLAVVSGMMQLQAFESEDKSLQNKLFDSVIRIKTMASVHELLYKSSSFSQLDFSETITKLVENISETLQTSTHLTLDIQSEDIKLGINKAIPASLIVNEVVTNVYKHAFVDRDKGELKFKVSEDDGIVTISIRDNGIGFDPDSTQKSGSLGLLLIRELSNQIDADYMYEDAHPGSVFTLTFPKAEVS